MPTVLLPVVLPLHAQLLPALMLPAVLPRPVLLLPAMMVPEPPCPTDPFALRSMRYPPATFHLRCESCV